MKKTIPLRITWLLFAVVFIVFGFTKLTLVGVLADILLLIAIVETIHNFIVSRKTKRSE